MNCCKYCFTDIQCFMFVCVLDFYFVSSSIFDVCCLDPQKKKERGVGHKYLQHCIYLNIFKYAQMQLRVNAFPSL